MIVSQQHRLATLFRHRDEKPVIVTLLVSALANSDARNPFRMCFYVNGRVSYTSASIFCFSPHSSAQKAICKSLVFFALRTLPSSVSCNSIICHSYENCRVYTNNSHSGTRRPPAPAPSPTFCLLFPFFSYSCELFCTHQKLNPFVFKQFRTLCAKHPGVGVGRNASPEHKLKLSIPLDARLSPAPGTFSGMLPTTQQPDAPLGDDDRTGLRLLYPDPADAVHRGSINGKIFPANLLALPASPPGVTGVFGAQVVAVDATSGAVVGATIGGWSCTAPGPAQFDGTYEIDGLAVGQSYTVYSEALNGAVDPSQFDNAIVTLCRNTVSDPGWPPLQGCVVPAVDTSFTARTRPGS